MFISVKPICISIKLNVWKEFEVESSLSQKSFPCQIKWYLYYSAFTAHSTYTYYFYIFRSNYWEYYTATFNNSIPIILMESFLRHFPWKILFTSVHMKSRYASTIFFGKLAVIENYNYFRYRKAILARKSQFLNPKNLYTNACIPEIKL